MPCRDFYDEHPEQYFRDVTEPALKARIAFAESALCAALTALRYHSEDRGRHEFDFFDHINYKSAGINKEELKKWYKEHRERDLRIAEEKKQAALAKLTKEDREILGLS